MNQIVKFKSILDNPGNILKIRKLYISKGHSDLVIENFMQTVNNLELNPFLKEVYLLSKGQIIVGRDGCRKIAQRNPDYDFHRYDAVYENDIFGEEDGRVKHVYNLKDRGKLIGAYCVTKRRHSSQNHYVYVDFKEYNLKQSLWLAKPATMIAKVAEVQCLRTAFSDMFSGTYSVEEYPTGEIPEEDYLEGEIDYDKNINSPEVKNDNIDSVLDIHHDVESGSSDDVHDQDSFISNQEVNQDRQKSIQDMHELIKSLLVKKEFNKERIEKLLKHYKVDSIDSLNVLQCLDCLKILGATK